jgi:hypothetical protein
MRPVQKIEKFLEEAIAQEDKNVYELLQYVRSIKEEENQGYIDSFKAGFSAGQNLSISEFADDVNEFLNNHIDAIELVNTYKKDHEYLIGFQQGLLALKKEFEFILNYKHNESQN